MVALLDTVQFLVSVYWPFVAVAALVGAVTGWRSLATKPRKGAS